MYNQDRIFVRLGKDDELPFADMDHFSVGGQKVQKEGVHYVINTTKELHSETRPMTILNYIFIGVISASIGSFATAYREFSREEVKLCTEKGKCVLITSERQIWRFLIFGIIALIFATLLFWLRYQMQKRILKRIHAFIDTENEYRWYPQGLSWIFDDDKGHLFLQSARAESQQSTIFTNYGGSMRPVSYTHLTLPTIYSV
eukprot:TRINITY_DN13989_c0_g1_i1.p1 TRINITY_DN13989_c0_g1~~TRINITY_DN13989_c0_g1_i1.p1  ORF type:complete len:201 (-),score=15.45 TRINITY_DN13989_c0_g1_i1:34-636(-)